MYPETHSLIQLASALLVIGVTALVGKLFGVSMSVAGLPMSGSRFWWTMAIFAAPLGISNQLLFRDGLLLQVALILIVAGVGIWSIERFLNRRGRS